MNLSATILLAFGMSMDAFAASIGKGATLHKPKFSEAVRTGLIFGAIETLTPLVGWGLGMLASQFILEWNHWIAFILLVFLGGRMIVEGFRGDSDAIIVRGLVAIVLAVYNDKSPSEIKNIAIEDIFAKLGLQENLSPSRRNGLMSMVNKIKFYAEQGD